MVVVVAMLSKSPLSFFLRWAFTTLEFVKFCYEFAWFSYFVATFLRLKAFMFSLLALLLPCTFLYESCLCKL